MSYRPSLRGPPIGGQDSDGVSNRRSVLYTLCLFEAFPSRGNEKIGGTGYCVTYDTDSQSRNVLASPLGEEGHEVAKGVQANWIHRGAPRPANPVRRHPAKSVWTVVILIMILDVDVTAEGGIIKLIARRAIHHPLNQPAKGRPNPLNLLNLHTEGVSNGGCVQGRSQHIENHHSCLSRLLNIVTVHDIL